jgi:rod shape-determining protein MreD
VPITYTSNEQIEVYRFSIPVTVGVPLVALFLQTFLPRHFPFVTYFDLPLLVVIFFAIARRSQVTGLLTGALIGLAQDGLTGQPIGLYSLTKTVVGYGASSLGVKLDVENAGARFLVTLFFYLLHEVVYFTVARGMLKMNMHYTWQHELSSCLLNAALAVALFAVLDRFKQRT